ncbi:MAG: leucine-rich repeat domain-containing protein, partial [Bacteroidales bacterium]|nr:leucine-rich repeat domain-containing protein [Bacteroidales bacterium]
SNLTNISLPDSLKDIGKGIFRRCYKLADFKIPKGLKHISECTFCECSSLKVIRIPEWVTEIDDFAFCNCNLESVICAGVTPPESDDVPHVLYGQIYENATLVVPKEAEKSYKAARGWRKFKNIETE